MYSLHPHVPAHVLKVIAAFIKKKKVHETFYMTN